MNKVFTSKILRPQPSSIYLSFIYLILTYCLLAGNFKSFLQITESCTQTISISKEVNEFNWEHENKNQNLSSSVLILSSKKESPSPQRGNLNDII